jgi:hypothetical protein
VALPDAAAFRATKVYWVAAEVRGGQTRYLTGGLGTINSATSKKYITYDPDLVNSLSVQGADNQHRAGHDHDDDSASARRQSG